MKTPLLMMLSAATLAVFPPQAEACTRAVYLGPGGMTVTGRTMDWCEDPLTNLYIFPRGTQRRGANTDNTVFWTSKYGSLSAAGYDIGVADGMNEAGLVASLLFLPESVYERPGDTRPVMGLSIWTQYVLDNFATVDEAVTELAKEKTGVEIQGLTAVNPVNGKEIPVWVSDYVLMSYGTGAIMAVPAHDDRDWEFAKKFNIPVIEVIEGGNVEEAAFTDVATGTLVNSGFLTGKSVEEAKKAIIEWLEEKGVGTKKTNFKLRDWVFSRQRYWGEPIPIVKCEKCGYVPIPEEELPLELPEVDNYMPTDNGESPIANIRDWFEQHIPQDLREDVIILA